MNVKDKNIPRTIRVKNPNYQPYLKPDDEIIIANATTIILPEKAQYSKKKIRTEIKIGEIE